MTSFKELKEKKLSRHDSRLRYRTDEVIVEKNCSCNGWKYDFCMYGFYKYCAHPNYFFEFCLWNVVLFFIGLETHLQQLQNMFFSFIVMKSSKCELKVVFFSNESHV